MSKNNDISRRDFLKKVGVGSAAVAGLSFAACQSSDKNESESNMPIPKGKMDYRVNPTSGDRVSLLGYGCMRWPTLSDTNGVIDQETVNRLVDFAIEHGVNYFDTSPAYCRGKSEESTGIALARHPRDKYFIATKLSNFSPDTWSHEASVEMYHNSLRYLQTDHIDYMLLHCIGQGATDKDGRRLDGMEALHARFIDNGMIDYFMQEREAGRIRNLGFSYHGDIKVYDYLLSQHDKYKWDFVQIQLNYVDWKHAHELNSSNTNADYLYAELEKRGIPAVIMEPLLGGRLAKLPSYTARLLKQERPEKSIASWAFRFAGTLPNVLTVLSGMTYMEHLKDNLHQYCPFEPCSDKEIDLLHKIGDAYLRNDFVPCTACQYCMPCPHGIDIPGIFAHYNKCINEGNYDVNPQSEEYARARRAYLVGYDRSVPKLRQADHCIGCGKCVSHCPQTIDIPAELHRIDRYVETLRQNP